jgi:hypothetical protein
MFVTFEVVEGVKWRLKSFDSEAGAKRSVTCAQKRAAKLLAKNKRAGLKDYGYMSAEDWANRVVPMKKVRSLMSGVEMEIPADTPIYCDPSSETYWSM